MTERTVALMECPYCQEEWILLRAQALAEALKVGKDDPPIHEVLAFGADGNADQPCKHLLMLSATYSEYEAGSECDSELDFGFVHPEVEPFTARTGIYIGLCSDFVECQGDPVQLGVHFVAESFNRCWQDRLGDGRVKECGVRGELIRVKDVGRLLQVLPAYQAGLQQGLQAGGPRVEEDDDYVDVDWCDH